MKIVYDSTLKDNICIADGELIRVTAIEARSDYSLLLTFSTGERKIFDFVPLLDFPAFVPLKDKALFASVYLEYGVPTWDGDIDISHEKLYNESIPA